MTGDNRNHTEDCGESVYYKLAKPLNPSTKETINPLTLTWLLDSNMHREKESDNMRTKMFDMFNGSVLNYNKDNVLQTTQNSICWHVCVITSL